MATGLSAITSAISRRLMSSPLVAAYIFRGLRLLTVFPPSAHTSAAPGLARIQLARCPTAIKCPAWNDRRFTFMPIEFGVRILPVPPPKKIA